MTYQFCKGDINKLVLLLMNTLGSWGKFDETSLPDEEAFYSKINEKKY